MCLTKNLNKAVKRNTEKFPSDFMFKSTKGRKYLPSVFTEYGVVALSGVLSSDIATRVNISIVRTFIKMRHLLGSQESLTDRVGKLEKGTDKLFRIVFERLENVENKVPLLHKDRNKIGLK